MEPLDIQFYRVSIMVLAGAATGLLLDAYRIFRWATSPRGILVHLEDLVFWLILTPVLILSLLVSNWVTLRLYMFAGFGLGLGSYLLLASPVVILALRFVVSLISRAVRTFLRWAAALGRGVRGLRRRLGATVPRSRIAAAVARALVWAGSRWQRR